MTMGQADFGAAHGHISFVRPDEAMTWVLRNTELTAQMVTVTLEPFDMKMDELPAGMWEVSAMGFTGVARPQLMSDADAFQFMRRLHGIGAMLCPSIHDDQNFHPLLGKGQKAKRLHELPAKIVYWIKERGLGSGVEKVYGYDPEKEAHKCQRFVMFAHPADDAAAYILYGWPTVNGKIYKAFLPE